MFANDWIRTADLWNWKRPLYQLSHNHVIYYSAFIHILTSSVTSSVARKIAKCL